MNVKQSYFSSFQLFRFIDVVSFFVVKMLVGINALDLGYGNASEGNNYVIFPDGSSTLDFDYDSQEGRLFFTSGVRVLLSVECIHVNFNSLLNTK